jgi:hypothetical protein
MIQANKINQNYYYPESLEAQGQKFLSIYEIETEVGCPATKLRGLKDKKQRQCRFCGKKYPYVSFSKDAHVISEMLGNKYLVSDFECDDCNSLFSRYENDLANFLGIVRTIQSVKGKAKVPKFKSSDKLLEAQSTYDPNEGTIIEIRRFDGLNKTFHFDKEKRQTVITYEKAPYIPLNVYKSLLKMALSLIDERHVNDYAFAFEYLRTTKYDNDITGFAFVTSYTMPYTFQFEQPAGLIFKKIDPNGKYFTHVFYLSTLNQVFQIVLPFNKRDARFYKDEEGIDVSWCPPLFGNNDEASIIHIFSDSLNLNSTEKLSHQKGTISMPSSEEDFKQRQIIDKLTGEITYEEFDGSKIIGINLLRREDPNSMINDQT